MRFSGTARGWPAPPEWPARRWGPRQLLAAIFVAACTLMALLLTAVMVADGETAPVRYLLLIASMFALTFVHGVLMWFPLRGSTRDVVLVEHEGRRGTALRYSGPLFAVQCALMAILTAIFAFGAVDYLRARDGVVTARYGAVAATAAIAAFLGSFLVAVASGRVQRGQVVLDSQGIYQRGRAFESALRWEDIVGAHAAYNGMFTEVLVVGWPDAAWQRRTTSRVWQLDRLTPVPMIEINCLYLALDQNLVHHLVTFYVENPQARSELGTPASLRRAGRPDSDFP